MKLRKIIKELEGIRGRHTELVSVYVPAGYNLNEVVSQLKNEQSTASNIKSKANRKNVVDALEKIIQHLRTFRQTPPNGLIVFGGNVSPVEGKVDLKLWSIEPYEKVENKVYWCDQVFVLEPLQEMVKEKEVYGLIVLDAKEANIGLLSGKKIIVLRHLDSMVPGKTTKGGWSQSRYEHVREMLLNDFLKEIGEEASKLLMQQENLQGVLLGGPGPTKDDFFKNKYMHYELQKKVLGVKDISYTDEYGLEELVKRGQDLIEQSAVVKEREIMEKFFTELQKNGNVVYGLEKTLKALDMGAVETLLISEDFNWVHVEYVCQSGHEVQMDLPKEQVEFQYCKICETKLGVEGTKDLTEALTEKAETFGTKVELISSDTREGKQFKEISGVGALLRYKI